jgi:hypothetical protein
MSSNLLEYDTTNKLIENERNCLVLDKVLPFKVHSKTKAYDDACYLDIQTGQSKGPGNYRLENLYSCECNIPDTVEVATSNHNMVWKDGYSTPNCAIDTSSVMRYGVTSNENPKCPQQLFHRPFKTTPYKGRGLGNIELETQLLPGENTVTTRPCNVLSGSSTLDRVMVPLVPHLKANVQNPENLIEEVAEDGWIRGGSPSRLVIRDVDYLQRCGYNYMDKEANTDFWA